MKAIRLGLCAFLVFVSLEIHAKAQQPVSFPSGEQLKR